MDIYQTLLVALISGFVGYLLSIWRNRLLPWVTLLSITTVSRKFEKVQIKKEVCKATEDSWFVGTLHEGSVSLGGLSEVISDAESFLEINEDTLSILKTEINNIYSEQSQTELIQSLYVLLVHPGISQLLEASISRGVITLQYDNTKPKILKYYEEEKQYNGCFVIKVPGKFLTLCKQLNEKKYRLEEIRSLIELIVRLDKDGLYKLFSDLYPIAKKILDELQFIKSETRNTVVDYSRWSCNFIISNYGSNSFLIFPETAKLVISGKHIKPFSLDCRVIIRSEDKKSNEWEEVDGNLLIDSSRSYMCSVVTKKTQKDIEGCGVLRNVYSSGEAEAFLRIEVLGRELPWKQFVKSRSIKFAKDSSD